MKGATQYDMYHRIHTAISIHAPVKGATWSAVTNADIAYYISIHAPVKGATS